MYTRRGMPTISNRIQPRSIQTTDVDWTNPDRPDSVDRALLTLFYSRLRN